MAGLAVPAGLLVLAVAEETMVDVHQERSLTTVALALAPAPAAVHAPVVALVAPMAALAVGIPALSAAMFAAMAGAHPSPSTATKSACTARKTPAVVVEELEDLLVFSPGSPRDRAGSDRDPVLLQ